MDDRQAVHKQLQQFSRDNWNKVPEEDRKHCLDHLLHKIPFPVLQSWKHDGYPEFFHHDGGRMVRNTLRQIMHDEELPKVKYPDGNSFSNWDDYYMGCLQELLDSLPEK